MTELILQVPKQQRAEWSNVGLLLNNARDLVTTAVEKLRCQMGGSEEEGVGLFSAVCSDRPQALGTQEVPPAQNESLFCCESDQTLEQLPEDVESPSVELFKTMGTPAPPPLCPSVDMDSVQAVTHNSF